MKGSTRNIYIKYCNRTKLWRVLVVAEAKLLDLFSLNFVKMLSLPWVSLKISGYLLQQYSNILTNWILEITRNRNQKFEWIRTLWQKRTDPALKIRKWEWEIRVERSHLIPCLTLPTQYSHLWRFMIKRNIYIILKEKLTEQN